MRAVISGQWPASRGRRERKRTQTREALQDAALRLCADGGYQQLTVQAIADECDVSARTFFNYFTSKDEALLSPGPEQFAALRTAVVARPADEPPMTALRNACSAYAAEVGERGSEQWRIRHQLVQDAPALVPRIVASFGEFERGLAEAVAARTGLDQSSDAYPALAAAVAVATLRVAFMHWRTGGESASLPRLVEELFDTVGGCPPPQPTSRQTSRPGPRSTRQPAHRSPS